MSWLRTVECGASEADDLHPKDPKRHHIMLDPFADFNAVLAELGHVLEVFVTANMFLSVHRCVGEANDSSRTVLTYLSGTHVCLTSGYASRPGGTCAQWLSL